MGLRYRPFHYLKDNKRTELPYNIVFLDTETREIPLNANQVVHQLRLGVACEVRYDSKHERRHSKWLKFTTAKEFWEWVFGLCRPKIRLYIVAHNLEYDIPVLGGFEVLKCNGWRYVKLINNHHTNIWSFRKGTTSLCFLDNMNYFNTSLAELGKSIGIAKLNMPEVAAPDAEWFTYCRRDVYVMVKAWDALLEFIKGCNLGSFGRTIPSQALNAYRHRFMPSPILIHDNSKAVDLERQAYFGGRVECFRLGAMRGQPFYRLDVNAMYPYIMAKEKYPFRLRGVVETPSLDYLLTQLKTQAVIAQVRVKVDKPCIPHRYNGRLCFPIGEFDTTLPTPELKLAIKEGYFITAYQAAIYDQASLFSSYVNYFYQLRLQYQQQGNIAFAYLCKLMLNSLYGKFGQKLEVWEKIAEVEFHPDKYWREWDADDEKWYSYRSINGVIERATGFEEGFNSLVAIPSHVTSYARCYLWSLMTQAGHENVYYCDTDSVIVNQAGYLNLNCVMDSYKLGYLKLECKSSHLTLNNVKDYRLGDEHKQKGIKANAEWVGVNCYRQDHFRCIRGSLHDGDINRLIVNKVTKQVGLQYNKGVVSKNGIISPFALTAQN